MRKESVTTFHKVNITCVKTPLNTITRFRPNKSFQELIVFQVDVASMDTVLVDGKDLQIFYIGFG